MMIAEITNQFSPPAQIAGWLACLGFVLWIVNLVWKLVDRAKQKPHPGDVQRESAEKFVSKTEFVTHTTKNDREHENIFSKIGGVERGAKSAVEQQVEVVRRDVIKCGNDIAGLQASTELQNQSLARVESKLDRLIERA